MTNPALILLTAALLSGSALGVFAFEIRKLDPAGPERLIAELRLSQWAAVLLAAIGAVPIGLAAAASAGPVANIDLTEGLAFVILAGVVLQNEPRLALRIVIAGLLLHALTDIAHRPGWLSMEVLPRWYAAGCAAYDVAIAALCFWAMRR